MITFNVAFGLWFLIGIFCAGVSFGYNECSWYELDFNMIIGILIVMLLGPLNLIFALGKIIGYLGSGF